MTYIIMLQSITQAVQKLLLTRGGRPEAFDELICKLVSGIGCDFFLPDFFYPVIDPLKHLDLISDNLGGNAAAATTNDRESFIFGFHQDFECFNPGREIGMGQEGRLTLQHRVSYEHDLLIRQNDPQRARGRPRMALKYDGCIAPVQIQAI